VLKIVSDGTPHGTKVYNQDDEGNVSEVKYIQSVEWKISMDGLAEVLIKAVKVPVEVSGEGQIETVELPDGR
jgi:hypothetical protein